VLDVAHPACGRIGDALAATGPAAGMALKRGGTYMVMEGPQFSSLAESELYRSWNGDVIGMTNMPEAKLAREAEICYATVAMVTCYAAALSWRFGWRDGKGRDLWDVSADRKRTSSAYWRGPLRWNERAQAEGIRRRVFCASMADVFDNKVPTSWRVDL
jgi:purine nucleoside phosphorylase